MLSLAYANEFEDSYFWTIVNTQEEYEKKLKKHYHNSSHNQLMYYKYCPEESSHWDMGEYAFELLNEQFINIAESQEYDSEEDEVFWEISAFDDFYDELEEICLHSIEDIIAERFIVGLNLKNLLLQFYVREYYSKEKNIEMFQRLNAKKKTAIN